MTYRHNSGQIGTNVNVPGDCWDLPEFKAKHAECWTVAEAAVNNVNAMYAHAKASGLQSDFDNADAAWDNLGCGDIDEFGPEYDAQCKGRIVDRCVTDLIAQYGGCKKATPTPGGGGGGGGTTPTPGGGGGGGGTTPTPGGGGGGGGTTPTPGGGGGGGGTTPTPGGGGGGTTPVGDKEEGSGSSPWLWVGIGAAVFGAALLYSATKE